MKRGLIKEETKSSIMSPQNRLVDKIEISLTKEIQNENESPKSRANIVKKTDNQQTQQNFMADDEDEEEMKLKRLQTPYFNKRNSTLGTSGKRNSRRSSKKEPQLKKQVSNKEKD